VKNAGLAAVLSFLIIGVGQIYNGQVGKGITMLVVAIILAITIIGLIGTLIIWIYGIVDAYQIFLNIHRLKAVVCWKIGSQMHCVSSAA